MTKLNVGVKYPDSGMPLSVEGRLVLTIGVGVIVGEGAKVAEGVAVKAGKSESPAAKIVKPREKVVPSSKVIVTVCWPGERLLGGVQCQFQSFLAFS